VRYFCLVLFFNLIIGSLFAQRALEINTRYGAGYRILGAKTDDSLLKDIINLRTREKPGVALDVSIMKISELSKSLNWGIGISYSRISYYTEQNNVDLRWPSQIAGPNSGPHDPLGGASPRFDYFASFFELPLRIEYRSEGRLIFIPAISLVNQLLMQYSIAVFTAWITGSSLSILQPETN
jgi:hypothetical protein